jgi:stage II sporulation protein D
MRMVKRFTLVGIACAVLAPASAPAADTFVIKGRGFGHGIGMSQYGAYGFAKHGRGYKRILGHYYEGTRIGQAGGERVRVLVGGGGRITFSDASRACGERLRESEGYRFERGGGGVVLTSGGGNQIADCGRAGGARGGGSVSYSGRGEYRGELIAVPAGGGLNAVNRVSIDDYAKGVVPNEVPASWPQDALRAQAVAARSYALATTVDGDGFDLYDDARSQVYAGKSSELATTNRAVNASEGEVVKDGGRTAVTYYFSTSGGETENVEYAFPGAEPRSYLKGVRDPYDDASPYHRWKLKLSRVEIEARLGGLLEGRLRDIDVVKTGASPRIVKARIEGTAGRAKVSGPALQSTLGLRSTWARFRKR